MFACHCDSGSADRRAVSGCDINRRRMHFRIMASRHSAFYTPLLTCLAFLREEGHEASYSTLGRGQRGYALLRDREVDIFSPQFRRTGLSESKGSNRGRYISRRSTNATVFSLSAASQNQDSAGNPRGVHLDVLGQMLLRANQAADYLRARARGSLGHCARKGKKERRADHCQRPGRYR